MLKPKKTIPGLVVAALSLTGCGVGEPAQVDDEPGEPRNTGGASGAAGFHGTAGGGGAAGGGGDLGPGIGGAAGGGGSGGMGGAVAPAALGEAFEAYCMKLGDCYSATYAEACLLGLPHIELSAELLSPECREVFVSYFSCLGDLECAAVVSGSGAEACASGLDEELLLLCREDSTEP